MSNVYKITHRDGELWIEADSIDQALAAYRGLTGDEREEPQSVEMVAEGSYFYQATQVLGLDAKTN